MVSLLHKQGYIHEVKSAISEFMQYGISTQDMDKLITSAQKRGALAMKLKDLKTLYRGFQDYIRDHFITTEETLDVLRRSLSKSKILKGSVVVFDGFTGFTPIQNRLIQELMRVCAETIVTVTIGVGEDPYKMDGEQKLFHLSKKTVADQEKLAAEAEVDTIITCDNAIAAINEIAHAKELGMTVLVTDHHEIPYVEEQGVRRYLRSAADAIVNP